MPKSIWSRETPGAIAWGFLLVFAARGQPAPAVRPLTLGSYMVVGCGSNATSAPMHEPGSSSTYCLDRSPVFDQRDIASATLTERSQNGPFIVVTLRDPVAGRLREITGKMIGNKIATILNGRLIGSSTIQAPVRQAWIYGLTLPEARSVVDALNHGAVAQAAPPPLAPRNPESEPDAQGIYLTLTGNGISPPKVIRKQEPEYTAAARAAGIQGTVILKIIVRADGTPDVVGVTASLDPGLDAKAIECARGYRFKPAQKEGMPVPVRSTLTITFRL